jgi:hypothetical protein
MHNSPSLQLDENNKEANRLVEANKQDRNKKRVMESQIHDVQILDKIRVLAQEAALREQQKWTEGPVSRSSGTHSSAEADVSQKRAADIIADIHAKPSFTLGDFDEEDFINAVKDLFADDLPAQALWVGTFQNLGKGFLSQAATAAEQEVKNSSPVQSIEKGGVASKLCPPQPEVGSPTGQKSEPEDDATKQTDAAGEAAPSESEIRQESRQESEPEQNHEQNKESAQEHSQESEATHWEAPEQTIESSDQWQRKLSAYEKELLELLCDEADNVIDNSYLSSEGRLISQKFIINIIPKVLRELVTLSNTLQMTKDAVFSSVSKIMEKLCYYPVMRKENNLTADIVGGLHKNSKNPYHSFQEWERDHKIAASLKLVPKGGRARRPEDDEKPSFS